MHSFLLNNRAQRDFPLVVWASELPQRLSKCVPLKRCDSPRQVHRALLQCRVISVYLFQLLQWLASLLSLNCSPAALSPCVCQIWGSKVLWCYPQAVLCFPTRTLHLKIPQHPPPRWLGWHPGRLGPLGSLCARPAAVLPASLSAMNTEKTKSSYRTDTLNK